VEGEVEDCRPAAGLTAHGADQHQTRTDRRAPLLAIRGDPAAEAQADRAELPIFSSPQRAR